jgi:alpha-L-fucosidase
MKINGGAIYGTKMFSVFKEGESVRFTQSKDGKTKYIFLFDFPNDKLSLTKIAFSKNAKVPVARGFC